MRAVISWCLAAAALGCGSRSGLEVAEAGRDGATLVMDDAGDRDRVPFSCSPGRFALARRGVEVVFVLDRSGSMEFDLDGAVGRPRRWEVLRAALGATLPRYEEDLAMGAVAFPRRFDGNLSQSCRAVTALDVEPARRGTRAILDLLATSEPWGATPIHDPVRVVGEALTSRVSRTRSVAIVLATDGGPNCNLALDPAVCACTTRDMAGRPTCFAAPANCLDDARTARLLADLAARGVPTYVIGLDTTTPSEERRALDRLAVAGGRPRVGAGEAYYSARRAESLVAAFDTVQRAASACTLVTPSRPDDPDRLQVVLAGAVIPRDVRHIEGWDWTDRGFGQVAFFGTACARVASSSRPPDVIVACGG